jgi:DNA repair photolyase
VFVRWDGQTVEADESGRLPGFADTAVVRRFDAPEAIDTRFYEIRSKSALNRVPGGSRVPFRWTVNPYRGCTHGCVYCFARPTHEYLDFNAGRDFEKEIVVKVNVPEVLRKELARPSWKREHVAMGTNTDPYQWVEGRYKLMRGIWAALRDAANPCSVLTKSPLLLRDLDLMLEIAERTEISACLSVPTLEEKAWRASEPHTPHPRARLEAVAKLNAAGIPTGILIAPLLPGINDAPEQVEEIIALATDAGAVSIGGQTLFLHGAVREIYFDWLRSYRPDLVPRYERLYARGGRVPLRERRAIERAAGLPAVRLTPNPERFAHRGGTRDPDPPPAPREEVRQESLF